ncbi:MAG: undecaprenyl/decaprenyl-phosphate alpha-N-acetylglucosaminyl 1-phosphate transferase, partial [Myxococcota bacterium]
MTTLTLLRYGATLLLSLSLSLYLTPLVRRTAERLGILDHPDAGLKQHLAPTPYLGGIAVYL